jgi:hypothetical protein
MAGRWFVPSTPVSTANKTDHHDITTVGCHSYRFRSAICLCLSNVVIDQIVDLNHLIFLLINHIIIFLKLITTLQQNVRKHHTSIIIHLLIETWFMTHAIITQLTNASGITNKYNKNMF